MSLAASIKKHNDRPRGLDLVLLKLGEQDRADLLSALDTPEIGHTAIARGLREVGVDVTEAAVRRWRDKTVSLEEAA